MKTLSTIFLAGMLALSGCKKGDDTPVTPATPEYQIAIDAKHKALGREQTMEGSPSKRLVKKAGYNTTAPKTGLSTISTEMRMVF